MLRCFLKRQGQVDLDYLTWKSLKIWLVFVFFRMLLHPELVAMWFPVSPHVLLVTYHPVDLACYVPSTRKDFLLSLPFQILPGSQASTSRPPLPGSLF